MALEGGGEMLTCELSVNWVSVGKITVRRTSRVDEEGRFAYGYSIRTANGSLERSGIVWHHPKDGIWALVRQVIELSRPEEWFPCPDREEGSNDD